DEGPDGHGAAVDPLAPDPSLAVTTVNHDKLRVRLFRVEVGDWRSYANYWERRWDDREPPPLPDWDEVADTTIDTDADANQLTETTIDLAEPGHVIVLVESTGRLAELTPNDNDYWSNRPTIVWAQSTFIGADAFDDNDELVVWATDLRSGQPLSGVEVTFAGRTATATTNADGLARTNKPTASSGPLVVRIGEDDALLDSTWRTSIPSDRSLWYVFDDRQMYRPGETAHFKGWVRRLALSDDAQLDAVPDDATIGYQVNDWYGNDIGSGELELNALGGFDFEVDLPAGANLGQAWINFTLGGVAGQANDHTHTFQIQEFRRPEFEVTTRAESEGPYVVGKPATVAVSAAYFSGGPLPAADVEWTVTTQQATYSPPNWDDFTFGVWIPWWFDDFFYAPVSRGVAFGSEVFFEEEYFGDFGPFEPPTVETFSGKTDASGTHFLQMDFDGDGEGLPTTVSTQATVFDVNRQAWSSGTDLLVHPGELYVGLRTPRTFVEKGEPLVTEAIVTDIDGDAVAERTITVEAGRMEWLIIDDRWEEVPVEIQTCEVSSAEEAVECQFATDIGGTYQITATVTDDAGRSSRTELTRWVSGGNRRPERNVVQEEVVLIPDRQEYSPGDRAEILVEAPFSPAEGLLTISRNGFVSTESFTIEGTGTVLFVPIEDDYVPNVHIQVDLVGTAERTTDAGDPLPGAPDRPAFAVGRLNLQVPPLGRTLAVDAQPAAPTIEPGSDTQVDVTVTDAAGKPVTGAELAVVVVDEAVLALSNYQLPDPLDVFYRPIDSRVSSRYLRDTIEL
ncbi:MAG: MG2 domain-containing protein, partial [Thermoanaerobaculia bacterium]